MDIKFCALLKFFALLKFYANAESVLNVNQCAYSWDMCLEQFECSKFEFSHLFELFLVIK